MKVILLISNNKIKFLPPGRSAKAPGNISLGHRRCVAGAFLYYGGTMFNFKNYFTKIERYLWLSSVLAIVISFLIFDRTNYLTLVASLIGVTSLIYSAKGNPFGQFLMIIFSLLYGLISYSFAYYGEMITYGGMTMPMALFALISWLRNPYNGSKTEVKVNRIKRTEWLGVTLLTIIITLIFYYILAYFATANLLPSTFSVTTSFLAVYLTFRRSEYFAVVYAINDIILIILWLLASLEDFRYISVVVCFGAFFINDIYGYLNWQKMKVRQQLGKIV